MREIADFAAALHLAIKALQFYSAEHPRVVEALAQLEAAVNPLITERGRISIVRAKGRLLIDGHPLDMSTVSLKSLEKHLSEHDFGGIILTQGINTRELLEVVRLFTLKPHQVKDAGGPEALLEKGKVIHARISHTRYAELTDGEEVVWAKSLRKTDEQGGSSTAEGADETAAALRKLLIQTAQGARDAADPQEIDRLASAITMRLGDSDDATKKAAARGLLLDAVAGFPAEVQFTLLVGIMKLPEGPVRDALAPVASELIEKGFGTAGRGGGGAGTAPQANGQQANPADVLRQLLAEGGGGSSDSTLDLIRGRLEQLGISREQLDELLGIFGWEKLSWSEKIEKLLSGDRIFDFPPDKLLSFLRELIMAQKNQEVYFLLERYGRGLGHESYYIRQNVSDTLGQVATYIVEPGLSNEIEQLLSKLLLNHLIRESDPRMHVTVAEAAANLLDSLVRTGRIAIALGHLKRIGTASAAASTRDPSRAASFAALIQTMGEAKRAERMIAYVSHSDAETFNGPGLGLLTFLGEGIAGPLITALGNEEDRNRRGRLLKALKAIGKPAHPHLINALHDPLWYIVRNAVNVLGDIGAPEHVPEIGKRLTHLDSRVRRAAVRALGKIGGPEAVKLLISALGESDPDTRADVFLSLGTLKAEAAVPSLVEIATSRRLGGDEQVRELAVTTLGQIGSPSAIPMLTEMVRKKSGLLTRDSVRVRIAAARSLAQIGTPEARDALQKAIASESDSAVRAQLQQAGR